MKLPHLFLLYEIKRDNNEENKILLKKSEKGSGNFFEN